MILSKRLLRRTDITLILAAAAIVVMSLVIIGSATHVNTPSEERYWFVQRQGISIIVDIAVAAFLMNFDYKILQRYGNHFYVFNLILLVLVMLIGQTALGAQRWIALGPVSIQPSEFSKLIMIIALAAMLEKRGKINSLMDLAPVAAYVGVPFFLVLKQPDLGTSLVFLAIFFGMVFAAGIRLRLLFGIFAAGLAAMPVLWHFLKDYQKMRIMVFMDPNVDPLGAGYHIIQSKIAIGSGMLFGKGLFGGTQSQLNFLPENHTDFIFSVVGEELGFVGYGSAPPLSHRPLARDTNRAECERYLRTAARGRHHLDDCLPRPRQRGHDDGDYARYRHTAAAHELRCQLTDD